MFVRRLKIMLGLIIAMSIALVLRTWQVEVLQHDQWNTAAAKLARDDVIVEPTRGKILDCKGRELARDEACLDAAVDYRAIIKEPEWIKTLAKTRLGRRSEYLAGDRTQRAKMLAAEIVRIGQQIDAMWPALAQVSGKTPDEIEDIRQSIIQRVELRKRVVWYNLYQKQLDRQQSHKEPSPWYKRWLIDVTQEAPELDSIQVTVGEEKQAHPVLRDISNDVCADLTRRLDEYPGLVVRDDSHRVYTEPASTCACFVLGHLSNVTADDLKDDAHIDDKLQRYLPNDLIGRDGIEKLAEPMLRGSNGRLVRSEGNANAVEEPPAVAGQDVRSTIDIDLQDAAQQLLQHAKVKDATGGFSECSLHGAVVLIDVPTGEVRALVSNPGFDLNTWEGEWAKLRDDDIDKPTLDRATMDQLEPGSTAKPMVGATGVTRHFIGVNDTIECTGNLIIDGKTQKSGRCWTMSMYGVGHHLVPYQAPHPTGFLTLSDALERSCNVYFQTLAHRMGMAELNAGFRNFGLGSPTGIGIAEARGHLPDPSVLEQGSLAWMTWSEGIGQGHILVTPIQMANVAATLARDGIWVRPHLLLAGSQDVSERRNLGLAPEALAAVKEGMMRVVNGAAGTGTACKAEALEANGMTMIVAAKTGTAQTGKFSVAARDAQGHLIKGAPRIVYEPGAFPWYQGFGDDHTHLSHAWYIGYAPADHPKIAFAVLVEYGGSGGAVPGGIARDMLAACVEHGYLSRDSKLSP